MQHPRLFCLFLIASLSAPHGFADIINFDDPDASAGDIVLDSLSPYHGFNWTNFSVYTNTPGFPGFNNGIVSAPNAAYGGGQNFGTSVTPVVGAISAATPFDFVSGYLGSGYYDDLGVTVEGLLNGTVVFSQTVTVNTEQAQLFTFDFDGINEVDFFGVTNASTTDPYSCGSFNCTQFTLDDLTFAPSSGKPPSNPTPEPSTSVLLGLSTIAIFLRYSRVKIWARLLFARSGR